MAAIESLTPAAETKPMFHIIAAASIGNALEWFDILVYGYLAVTLSNVFFPATDQTVSLLLTLGTFGVSYLVRPLGAIFLGGYADRAGRKAALTLSILLMSVGTLGMVLVPSYAQIGIAAPIIVLIARLLQGFSVGGEFGIATAFMAEHGSDRKGFYASWQWSGQGLAAAIASAFGVGLATLMSPADLQDWGWRLPFAFGLLVAPIGWYIRRHVEESPEFLAEDKASSPVREVVTQQWDRLLLAIGAVVISTSANYILLYMPTYGVKELHLPQSVGFTATLIGGLLLTFGAPVAGHLSDRFGRVRTLIATSVLFIVTAVGCFSVVIGAPSLLTMTLVVLWLSLLKTSYSGVLPSFMAELFPTRTRSSGLSLSYNIAVPIFGGFAPFVVTWLISLTKSNLAPAYYLMLTATISMIVLIIARRRIGMR